MGSTGTSARVVVADGHPMRRVGYTALLNASPGITVVGEAETGAEAVHLALATHPDVVLVDALVPVLDGIATTRQLVVAHRSLVAPTPRVLVLAGEGTDSHVYESVREGARGFLPRDARPDVLADAVRVAAVGGALPNAAEVVHLVSRYATTLGSDAAEQRAALSTGDAIVAVGVGRGHADDEIAANLGITTTEVRRRVDALLESLGLVDRTQLVVFAYESGLIDGGRVRA